MRLFYYPETHLLYVEFQDRPSVDTREIGPEIRLDLDDTGRPVGLDMDHASLSLDLSVLAAKGLPHVGAPPLCGQPSQKQAVAAIDPFDPKRPPAGGAANRCRPRPARQPRPTKGILVAMTVMNRTLASSGRLAM